LSNFSLRLSDFGGREGALPAIEESVHIYRDLAEEHPAAILPDLAWSLSNLSVQLSDFGKREEALAAIQESLNIRRNILQSPTSEIQPALAITLGYLSLCLTDVGHQEDAIAPAQEAAGLLVELCLRYPKVYQELMPDIENAVERPMAIVENLRDRNQFKCKSTIFGSRW
jgi:tetratricopeptide (TPR) repeat protein